MKHYLRHVPNTLSVFRLLAAPAVAFCVLQHADSAALVIFVLAGISDALDGYLARTFAITSRFGAMLDPAADKLLMLASFLTLTGVGLIPWWLTLAVIGRDVAIVTGVILAKLLAAPLKIHPLIAGKASTVVQVVYVALVLIVAAFDLRWVLLQDVGAFLVVLFAIWSLLAYATVWLRAVMTRTANAG